MVVEDGVNSLQGILPVSWAAKEELEFRWLGQDEVEEEKKSRLLKFRGDLLPELAIRLQEPAIIFLPVIQYNFVVENMDFLEPRGKVTGIRRGLLPNSQSILKPGLEADIGKQALLALCQRRGPRPLDVQRFNGALLLAEKSLGMAANLCLHQSFGQTRGKIAFLARDRAGEDSGVRMVVSK